MIRVTVELCPGGDQSKPRLLGIALIANNVRDTVESGGARGTYLALFSKWAPKQDETWKRGRVTGFDRVKRGAWDLLYLALRDAVGDRNPDRRAGTP